MSKEDIARLEKKLGWDYWRIARLMLNTIRARGN
jgi:hypothetical protein